MVKHAERKRTLRLPCLPATEAACIPSPKHSCCWRLSHHRRLASLDPQYVSRANRHRPRIRCVRRSKVTSAHRDQPSSVGRCWITSSARGKKHRDYFGVDDPDVLVVAGASQEQAYVAARTFGLEGIKIEIRRMEDIAPAFEPLKDSAFLSSSRPSSISSSTLRPRSRSASRSPSRCLHARTR